MRLYMLLIKKPYIKRMDRKSRIYCDIFVDDDCRSVWFEVDKQYEKYLCTERSDAYLIGLLNWAMREGHDIKCEVPVTEELLYNINNYLIPTLVSYGESLKSIKIVSGIAPTIMQGTEVGTGLSCGVDSFSAICSNSSTSYTEHNISMLCINNVGAFNECYSEYGEEKVREERYVLTEKVAQELNLPLVTSDSNFSQVFPQNHLLSHTYSSCFAIYMLQKLWKIYYYASTGIDYSMFSIISNDTKDAGLYELLSLQCFSTSGLRIYNDGGTKTRLQKTKEIANYPLVQKYLHVCTTKPYNCSVCPKCKRTILSLEALGVLDRFREVFDVDYFYSHKHEYYIWLYNQHMSGDAMNEPVYLIFAARKDFIDIINEAFRKPPFIRRIKNKINKVFKN